MIKNNQTGEKTFIGCVYGEYEKMWSDGMLQVYALVWDPEQKKSRRIPTEYIGSDCRNIGDSHTIDINVENARDMIRCCKKSAKRDFAIHVTNEKQSIKAGRTCKVIKGRKVKKGTIVNVFWIGEKETYLSRQYAWMHETETLAGAYDQNGNKIWIKAEYLQVIDTFPSPTPAERKQWINDYIEKHVPHNVRKIAREAV